jgi:hypothetical protein
MPVRRVKAKGLIQLTYKKARRTAGFENTLGISLLGLAVPTGRNLSEKG